MPQKQVESNSGKGPKAFWHSAQRYQSPVGNPDQDLYDGMERWSPFVCSIELLPLRPKPVTLSSKPPIRRSKSLHEQVYEALRAAILGGDLQAGERLVETQLADWLQVSRTPLREALRQLQQDGLVTADVNGGLRVTTLTPTEAIELYDCRLALEGLAAAGACVNATPEQLSQIEAYVLRAEGAVHQAPQTVSCQQLLELDYQFHRLIAESSGNRRLVSLLDSLFDAMALLRIQTLKRNPKVLDIQREHRQIYEAIATGNPEVARDAISRHLLASKARVVLEIEEAMLGNHSLQSKQV
jgi:DNA-binding GntR family transcriptional regulator